MKLRLMAASQRLRKTVLEQERVGTSHTYSSSMRSNTHLSVLETQEPPATKRRLARPGGAVNQLQFAIWACVTSKALRGSSHAIFSCAKRLITGRFFIIYCDLGRPGHSKT